MTLVDFNGCSSRLWFFFDKSEATSAFIQGFAVDPQGWLSEPPWASVRFRTVGDMTCTACVESTAASVEQVIEESRASRLTERGASRADDKFSETAMEDRKREGYF